MRLFPFAVASLVFYAMGFPLFLGWLISRNAEAIDEDMKMRAKQEHHKRKANKNYGMALRYGRFYKYFKPECKQWNLIIALRKFFLAATALLFRDNPTFQLSIALLGMFTAFVYQVVRRPYWSIEEREKYVRDLYEKEKAMIPNAAMKFINNLKVSTARKQQFVEHRRTHMKGKKTDKKKIVPNDDGEMASLHHEEQKAVMQSAKSVLFNLNTIEGYTLASTVMVNLSGIMLLSGQFEGLDDSDEYQRDLITYTILAIIFSSFAYLAIAFLREIRFARNIGNRFIRARWRAAIRKQIAINRRKKKAALQFQDIVYMVMRRHNVGTYAGSMAMANLDEVKSRDLKVERSDKNTSGFLSSFLAFGGKKSKNSSSIKPTTGQMELSNLGPTDSDLLESKPAWDSGPNMDDIMPAPHISMINTIEESNDGVEEADDLY